MIVTVYYIDAKMGQNVALCSAIAVEASILAVEPPNLFGQR